MTPTHSGEGPRESRSLSRPGAHPRAASHGPWSHAEARALCKEAGCRGTSPTRPCHSRASSPPPQTSPLRPSRCPASREAGEPSRPPCQEGQEEPRRPPEPARHSSSPLWGDGKPIPCPGRAPLRPPSWARACAPGGGGGGQARAPSLWPAHSCPAGTTLEEKAFKRTSGQGGVGFGKVQTRVNSWG